MTQSDYPATDANSANGHAGAPHSEVSIDIISIDGGDPHAIAAAAAPLGAAARRFAAPEAWFEKQSKTGQVADPTDIVVLHGDCGRIAALRLVARARAAAPDASIVVASADAGLQHVAAVVNQGASGLLPLSQSSDSLSQHLSEVVEPARRKQPQRRAAAKHRQSLAALTSAESDVLDLMLDGLANKQIAQRLSIGLRTVELRRSKIMRKMDASSVAQLISHVCAARHV